MIIGEKEFKIYELYKHFNTKEQEAELEKEFFTHDYGFSRIDFKEYRDKLTSCHKGYAIDSHNGNLDNVTHLELKDKFSLQMYCIDRLNHEGEVDYGLGKVIDYNVRIKRCKEECSSDIEIGKFDLITETSKAVNLIIASKMDSQETLFKFVLEVVSKRNMISRTKLISDYTMSSVNPFKFPHTKDHLVPSVLLFEGSQPHKDLLNLKPNSLVNALIEKYHIHFFVLQKQHFYNYSI